MGHAPKYDSGHLFGRWAIPVLVCLSLHFLYLCKLPTMGSTNMALRTPSFLTMQLEDDEEEESCSQRIGEPGSQSNAHHSMAPSDDDGAHQLSAVEGHGLVSHEYCPRK